MLPDMETFSMLKNTSLQAYIQTFSFSAIISFLNSNLTIMGYNENATSFIWNIFLKKCFLKYLTVPKILEYSVYYIIFILDVFKLIVKFSKTFCSIIMLKHLKHNYFDNIT